MRSVTKNLEFIRKNKVRVRMEGRHLPGGVDHNLICWLCNKRPAVYSAHPDWVFLPCWECQKEYDGIWNKNIWEKKWWEFWK